MSLIKCPECKKKVSDKAVHCVKCGYPIRKTSKCPISAGIENIRKSTEEIQKSLSKDEEYESASTALFKVMIIMIYVLIAAICIFFIGLSFYELIPQSPVIFITTAILSALTLLSFLISIIFSKQKAEENQRRPKKVTDCVLTIVFISSFLSLCAINVFFMFTLQDDQNAAKSFLSFLCTVVIALAAALSKEVWFEKDKNYIISYIALILTLVIAIIQK